MTLDIRNKRSGTAAEWTAANRTLGDGETGVETDTGKTKTGDGVSAWADLEYDPGSGGSGASGVAPATALTTVTAPNPVSSGDMTVNLIPASPGDDALLAFGVEGEDFPRVLIEFDGAGFQFYCGNGSTDPYNNTTNLQVKETAVRLADHGSNGRVDITSSGVSLTGGAGKSIQLNGAPVDMPEITDPAAPAANRGRLYMRDNGAGKTELVALFPSGAAQVIATEP